MIQWITIDQIFPIEYCRISWTDFFHSHGQARKLCGCPSRQDPISRQLYGDGWTGKDTWKFVSVCGTYNFSKHMYENAQHLVGEGWRECTILQVSGGLCRRQEKIDGRCIQSWRSMWIWHFLGRRDPDTWYTPPRRSSASNNIWLVLRLSSMMLTLHTHGFPFT